MPTFELHINGKNHMVEADSDMPLLWALRDLLGLTGTKYGCGIGQCGVCTVHINDNAVRSCTLPLYCGSCADFESGCQTRQADLDP